MSAPDFLRRGPVPLDPANFTPLARTPWGGTSIGRVVKAALVPDAVGKVVGESWEFSCGPEYPSAILGAPAGEPTSLPELIQRYPDAVLSPQLAQRTGGACELLVKILDAAQPLSVQVHPADGDPSLEPGECGKPESWLVLAAEPGAGIYLGFSRAFKKSELARLWRDGGSEAAHALHFEKVRTGDYFEIGPGVPHAIGGGVMLLEPQRVLYGRSGKTLRLWDWGRKYDAAGQPDPMGKPRALHVDEGLALIDPEQQVGAAFAQSLRRDPHIFEPEGGARVRAYPSNPYYRTYLIEMPAGAQLKINAKDGYGAAVMLTGEVSMNGTRLARGQPALLPHAAMPLRADAVASSTWALIVPARINLSF